MLYREPTNNGRKARKIQEKLERRGNSYQKTPTQWQKVYCRKDQLCQTHSDCFQRQCDQLQRDLYHQSKPFDAVAISPDRLTGTTALMLHDHEAVPRPPIAPTRSGKRYPSLQRRTPRRQRGGHQSPLVASDDHHVLSVLVGHVWCGIPEARARHVC